jgi:hypothetical protein
VSYNVFAADGMQKATAKRLELSNDRSRTDPKPRKSTVACIEALLFFS